jgi:hypothetical protein
LLLLFIVLLILFIIFILLAILLCFVGAASAARNDYQTPLTAGLVIGRFQWYSEGRTAIASQGH